MKHGNLLLLLITFFSISASALISEQHLRLHFDSDKYQLTKHHIMELTEFLEELELIGDFEFVIRGHTDQEGSDEYNLILSEHRTESITKFLTDNGILKEFIGSSYAGESELLVHSLNTEEYLKNRRVDITFRHYFFESVEELQSELKNENITSFELESDQTTTLVGESGTRLLVKPNSFLNADGSVYTGKVNLVLTESISMDSFISHGLSTESEGEMLISGGMFKTEATGEDGYPLELNSSTPILTALPTNNLRENMSVFISDTGTDWELTSQKPLIKPNDTKVKRTAVPPKFEFKEQQFTLEGKPMVPTVSSKPKLPQLPDSADYFLPIPWQKTLSTARIKNRQKTSYELALRRYDQKLSKYESRLAKFKSDSATIDSRRNLYQIQMRAWEIEFNKKKKKFVEESIESQYNQWIMQFPSKDYQSFFTEYQAAKDSVMSGYYESLELLDAPLTLQNSVYIFNQVSLGWVNIDCFSNDKGPKRDILVHNNTKEDDAIAFILFPKMNSCISKSFTYGTFEQKGVPIGNQTKLVCYKVIDGQVFYYEKDITNLDEVDLVYEQISFTKFKEKIKALA